MPEVKVDGAGIQVPQGATALRACDQSGRSIVGRRATALEAAK